MILLVVVACAAHARGWGLGHELVFECRFGSVGCFNPQRWRLQRHGLREYAGAWRLMGPVLRRKLAARNVTADASFARTVVVHFRCSDVPFNRHDEYVLSARSYYEAVAARLAKSVPHDAVAVLLCPGAVAGDGDADGPHRLAATKCPEFGRAIAGWLGGTEASLACKTDPYAALSAMLGAAALVSSGGSFSFVAGVARDDPATFFSPTLAGVGDFPAGAQLAPMVPWSMVHAPVIGHDCVADYATFDSGQDEGDVTSTWVFSKRFPRGKHGTRRVRPEK